MVKVKLDEEYVSSIGFDILNFPSTQAKPNIGEIRLFLYSNAPKFKTVKETYAYRDGIDVALVYLERQKLLNLIY